MVRYTAEDVKNNESSGLPAPGTYLAEVDAKGTELRHSKRSGDPMFNVAFKDVQTGKLLCYDTIMMGGRGVGIGHKKLIVLGVVDPDAEEWDVEAIHLVGRRVNLTIKHEEYTGNDGKAKTTCKVDFDANDSFGYAVVDDDGLPF
jgi:hypothetical protein